MSADVIDIADARERRRSSRIAGSAALVLVALLAVGLWHCLTDSK